MSKYNPFKRRRCNGPGPKNKTNKRAKNWECECEQHKRVETCWCKRLRTKTGRPSKELKKVTHNLDKKKVYAKLWRKHRKRPMHKAHCPVGS